MSITDQDMIDKYFMNIAIAEARKAGMIGEIPIGAVIVCNADSVADDIDAETVDFSCGRSYKIISVCHNRREIDKNALFHAECEAVSAACKKLNSWRLNRCTLYVTLEPCPMCAGAVINSRISRVVYGVKDPSAGAFGSVVDLSRYPFNHKPQISGGVEEEQCADILKKFFASLRLSKKIPKSEKSVRPYDEEQSI